MRNDLTRTCCVLLILAPMGAIAIAGEGSHQPHSSRAFAEPVRVASTQTNPWAGTAWEDDCLGCRALAGPNDRPLRSGAGHVTRKSLFAGCSESNGYECSPAFELFALIDQLLIRVFRPRKADPGSRNCGESCHDVAPALELPRSKSRGEPQADPPEPPSPPSAPATKRPAPKEKPEPVTGADSSADAEQAPPKPGPAKPEKKSRLPRNEIPRDTGGQARGSRRGPRGARVRFTVHRDGSVSVAESSNSVLK